MATSIAKDDSLGAAPSRDTIQRIITSSDIPPRQADACALVTVLTRWAGAPKEQAGHVAQRVAELWTDAKLQRPLGQPVRDLTNPLELEVHRAIDVSGSNGEQLPLLPVYVQRSHDVLLRGVVDDVVAGTSRIVMLVGQSSTGKTRACWEAVQQLPDRWRVWHPIDPERPRAALAELPQVGPHTVIWLNEAQHYLLNPRDGAGEEIAAGLRELLRSRHRGPVLVLGTIWPEYRAVLMTEPQPRERDPHAQARELLAGQEIAVPARFDSAALRDLSVMAAADPRLAIAQRRAEGGGITQYLAGAPELLDRYRTAPAGARALLNAAMDARRLGHVLALPQSFLGAAAEAYLEDPEWDLMPEDWLEQAAAYCARPVRGARGTLTRIRPRAGHAVQPQETGYRLADYLEQHGQRVRRALPVPAGFCSAALACSGAASAARLGQAAHQRGLYRTGFLLQKRAAEAGDVGALRGIAEMLIGRDQTEEATAWYEQAAAAGDTEALRWAVVHRGQDGRVDDALPWFEHAAERGETVALRWAANMLDLAGRVDDALDWFERATEAGDFDAPRWAANMLDREGRTYEALDWYERAARAGDTEAVRWAADIQIKQGKVDQAVAWHQQAAASGDARVLLRIAELLARAGEIDDALHWYERAHHAGESNAARKAADLLHRQKRIEEALAWYERADSEELGLSEAAQMLQSEGRIRDALAWYERAHDAGELGAARKAADLLHGQKRIDEALTWYKRAADSGELFALNEAGRMLEGEGRLEDAEIVFQRLRDLQEEVSASWSPPRTGGAALLKAATAETEADGHLDDALALFQRAADAGRTDALRQAATHLANAGRLHEALVWFQRAADAGEIDALIEAAFFLHTAGRVDDALAWYRLAAFSGDARALFAAGGLLAANGRSDDGERLTRYGWEPDGSIAAPWSASAPGRSYSA